jgi:hypothetical protein
MIVSQNNQDSSHIAFIHTNVDVDYYPSLDEGVISPELMQAHAEIFVPTPNAEAVVDRKIDSERFDLSNELLDELQDDSRNNLLILDPLDLSNEQLSNNNDVLENASLFNELTVDTLVDENNGDLSSGDVSLREAIAFTEAGGKVSFSPSLAGGTIQLTQGELVINKDLIINGLGANNLTVSGNNSSRVFLVNNNNNLVNVEINGLTIANGFLPTVFASGAGILNYENLKLFDIIVRNNRGGSRGTGIGNFSGGFLKMSQSVVKENSNDFRGAVGGAGGIANSGEGTTMEIEGSTISDNSSAKNGGGIYNGNGMLTIKNSTISGNKINAAATGFGGAGILNISNIPNSELNIQNSTISGNKIILNQDSNVASFIGGGININSGRALVTNTIVADNKVEQRDRTIIPSDVLGSFSSSRFNLIGNLTGSTGLENSKIEPNINKILDTTLRNNGGLTATHALVSGSPAINAGDRNFTTPPEFDQRGNGFPRIQGGRVDIGAFEVPLPPLSNELTVDTLVDENDGDLSLGDVSLREAITFTQSGGKINFASSLVGGTIDLRLGELIIDKDLDIDGLGADKLTIDGNNTSRVFNVSDENSSSLLNVKIKGLTIANGSATLSNSNGTGGGISNSEDLTVTNSIISNNKGTGLGAGVSNSGVLKLFGSTVSNNEIISFPNSGGLFTSGGGIFNFSTGTIDIDSSTISANKANRGGGIHNEGNLKVIDSTISGNQSAEGGGGILLRGPSPTADISLSTIANNEANIITTTGTARGGGGGILAQTGTLAIKNTIIAGNKGRINPDVDGTFTSDGFNLIGNTTGSRGFENDKVEPDINKVLDIDLKNNGGLTETHALVSGSPAINAGDQNFTPPPNFDQRGNIFPRIQDGRIDIGAFEVGAPLPTGGGGKQTFVINLGDSKTIADFGGIGLGSNPSTNILAEVDTLKFMGADLTARNLLLTQNGTELEITFEGIRDTKVILQNFALENLENLTSEGNILFNEQNTIQDSFDVINANSTQPQIFNRQTVTFLNDRNNDILGFDNSNDVVNGQGGDDIIDGLTGNDLLRGGEGKDFLLAGAGSDILVGGEGDDFLDLGIDQDIDTVVYRSGDGSDTVRNFNRGSGGDLFNFQNIPAIDVITNGNSTLFLLSDGIEGNNGFGTGESLLRLSGTTNFTEANLELNLAAGNITQFLFT